MEKIPDKLVRTIIELIKWRDSTKYRRKAMAIQRVINRKLLWAKEHGMKRSLYMHLYGEGYARDLYGRNWGRH
nr:MAG TPA: hypothetical protein [Caudoviricetes sp.]